MLQKFIFLGKSTNKAIEALSQRQNFIPANLDTTKLQFSFYNKFSFNKFCLINKSTLYINIGLVVLLVIGMIIFGIFGFSSNALFRVSHCLMLSNFSNIDNLQIQKIINEHGINILSSITDNQKYLIFTNSDLSNVSLIVSIKSTILANLGQNVSISVGNIVGNTNKDILLYAIISVVVASLISSLYAGVKSN